MRFVKTFEEYSQNNNKVKCGFLKRNKAKKTSDKEGGIDTKELNKHSLISTATTQEIVKSFDPENDSQKIVNLGLSDM